VAAIAVTRTQHRILPDPRRVLAKPFLPGEEVLVAGPSRASLLLDRILAIPEPEVRTVLEGLLSRYSVRHRDFREEVLGRHFLLIAHHVRGAASLSTQRRLLIGAYFTHEYSVEAAALFNPSIVIAPDQASAGDERRFVMSARAVGEGHLSSIEFRSGRIDGQGRLTFDPPSRYLVNGRRTAPVCYDKALFATKLVELGAGNDIAWAVLDRLGEQFSPDELEGSLGLLEHHGPPHAVSFETAKIIRVLASSNYVTTFPSDSSLSERVLFPAGPNETRGMEDARFVRFCDGAAESIKYYATYTAYDGFQIVPQLIETDDFVTFAVSTLNGSAAQNKGMALFPRKVRGNYVMLSRKDRENLHLATSPNVRFWNDSVELYRPSRPWELLQVGNCGSPLETSAGWLVLTHGVGPMREYALGALLLDLDDPEKVIGQLAEPLLIPETAEREGYVPNVVYTCGGLIVGDQLVLPYGLSDSCIGVVNISLPDVLAQLSASRS
jgi:predicted GH43/DUF377 family glycosyl hydrolase